MALRSEQSSLDTYPQVQRPVVGTALIDTSLRFLELDDAMAAMNGVALTETLGRLVEDVIPDLASAVVPLLRHVIATGEPVVDVEILGRTAASADERRWRMSYLPVRSRSGTVLGVDVSVQDLGFASNTRHAKLAQQFDHNQLQELLGFQELIDLSHEAIIIRDSSGYILWWNRGATELYGWELDDVRGQTTHALFRTRFPADQATYSVEAMDQALEKQGRWEGTLLHTRRNGMELVVESRQVARYDAVGKRIQILEINRDITAHWATQAALHESQALSSRLFENSPNCVKLLDLEGRLRAINARGLSLMGIKDFELVRGVEWASFCTGPDREAMIAAIAEARSGKVGHFHGFCPTFEGTPKWWDVLLTGIPDRNGAIQSLLAVSRDITSQHLGEIERAEILEREQKARREADDALSRLDALLDRAPVGIGFWDTELRYLRLNKVLAEINGMPVEAHLGRTLRDVVPNLAEQAEMLLRAVLATGESVSGIEVEGETSAEPGVRRTWRVSHYPVTNREGALLGVGAVVEDTTEQKRATNSLSLLAEMSGALSESLDVATTLSRVARLALPAFADYCVVDLKVDGGTNRVESVHVDPAKELILKQIEQRYPPRPESPIWRVLRDGQALLAPEMNEHIMQTIAHDAEHLAMLQTLHPQCGIIVPMRVHNRVLGVITFGLTEPGRRYDEGDLVLAELIARRAALAVDNAQLYAASQSAVREREAFLSVASHEMKNPLTTLLGYSNWLQRSPNPHWTEREQRALTIIHEQAQRLNHLIDELLDLSRIETGQLTIQATPVDFVALVRRLADELAPTLTHHALDVSLPTQPVMVKGDAARLEQVLQNLLNNALKYSLNGGTIGIRVEQRDDDVCIIVSDQGIGIPVEAQARIFERFYRVPGAGMRVAGSGIGLFVVKEIVAQHGGEISVQSAEGQGSTFEVCLPTIKE